MAGIRATLMKVELDGVIHIGEIAIATLALSSVHCSGRPRGLLAHCAKKPVAILIRHNDVTIAFEIDGSPIPMDAFEQRYPGQCSAFERIAVARTNSS